MKLSIRGVVVGYTILLIGVLIIISSLTGIKMPIIKLLFSLLLIHFGLTQMFKDAFQPKAKKRSVDDMTIEVDAETVKEQNKEIK